MIDLEELLVIPFQSNCIRYLFLILSGLPISHFNELQNNEITGTTSK